MLVIDNVTLNVARFVADNKIKATKISRMANIPYNRLRYSLLEKGGSLRAEEYLKICKVIGYPIWNDLMKVEGLINEARKEE